MGCQIVSSTPEPVGQGLGRELCAESLPPRPSWTPFVPSKKSENIEEKKSKMQLVKLFGQLLNVLNIILFLLSFFIYGAITVTAATQQKSLWDSIYYVRKISLIPSSLGLNQDIYFTDKIFTSALVSSVKAFFSRLFWKRQWRNWPGGSKGQRGYWRKIEWSWIKTPKGFVIS